MGTITITITHTRADGTLLEGSCKGDGVLELVRPHGFRWFPSLGCLGIPRSRDKRAQQWRIDAAKAALEAAGWTVEVTIDEGIRRSFADAEADRAERAEDRAERYEQRAERAQAASDGARDRVQRISDGIPVGQPILVGHHSERRARRDVERIDSGMRRSISEGERAGYWAARAEAAGDYARFRNSPPVTLRRIDKLEADRRGVLRSLEGCEEGSACAEELVRRRDELDEQLAYWRHVVAKAEADGFKVWSRADFKKGDFVRYRNTWYEVLRVNAKSVTIPHIHNGIGRYVVRKGDGHLDWTWTVGYHDGITGRMSAGEMAAHLEDRGLSE